MPGWRISLAGALALTIAATPLAAPVAAAPVAPMTPGVAQAAAGGSVTQVRYRHHHHHHGGGVGVGIGLGIIGGLLAAEAYRSAPGYAYDEDDYDGPPPGYSGDPRALCAERFRSFEWNTGMYTTYSGEKRLCPYLR